MRDAEDGGMRRGVEEGGGGGGGGEEEGTLHSNEALSPGVDVDIFVVTFFSWLSLLFLVSLGNVVF